MTRGKASLWHDEKTQLLVDHAAGAPLHLIGFLRIRASVKALKDEGCGPELRGLKQVASIDILDILQKPFCTLFNPEF